MKSIKKKRRVGVTMSWLATLKNSYDLHFSHYCRNKKNPVQRIPAQVWKHVYSDFLAEVKQECAVKGVEFDGDDFPTERNLQDSLRDFLQKLGTGTSNSASGETVTPQSHENLEKIRLSDAHARRNMINLRESLIAQGDASDKGRADAAASDREPKKSRIEKRLDVPTQGRR